MAVVCYFSDAKRPQTSSAVWPRYSGVIGESPLFSLFAFSLLMLDHLICGLLQYFLLRTITSSRIIDAEVTFSFPVKTTNYCGVFLFNK